MARRVRNRKGWDEGETQRGGRSSCLCTHATLFGAVHASCSCLLLVLVALGLLLALSVSLYIALLCVLRCTRSRLHSRSFAAVRLSCMHACILSHSLSPFAISFAACMFVCVRAHSACLLIGPHSCLPASLPSRLALRRCRRKWSDAACDEMVTFDTA